MTTFAISNVAFKISQFLLEKDTFYEKEKAERA